MNHIKLFFSFCFALCISYASAQTGQNPIISVLPVSPEAGSLGKFIDQPVSYSSGIPQIGIPIRSIKKGDIVVDVGLSYHAGGNKVDEIASRVGLGWNLNAGGAIIRSTRSLPDLVDFYFDYDAFNALNAIDRANYLMGVSKGEIDSEPDIYYVNAGNLNVKIFKDNDNNWHTMPADQRVKIEQAVEGHDWIITDGTGVRYKFSSKEISESTVTSGTVDGSYFSGVSAWLLTQIEDSKGNIVDFVYENITYSFTTKNGETKLIPMMGSGGNCTNTTIVSIGINAVLGLRIKAINFSDGKLEFKYATTPRLDQASDYSLSSIEIHNKQSLLKTYRLFTSYFINNTTGVNISSSYTAIDQYRLKLDSVREESAIGILPPYRFTYFNNQGLPYLKANSQDHWGYFNGYDNIGTAVSYIEFGIRKGARKTPNPIYAMETILTKVQYPTGGTTEFDYEGNTYADFNEINGDEVPTQLLQISGNNARDFHTSDNLNHYFTKTFTVTPDQLSGGAINVTKTITVEGIGSLCNCSFNAQLQQPDNSVIMLNHLPQQVFTISQAGTYTFTGIITTEFENTPYIYFEVALGGVIKSTVKKNITGPGLRIKSIKRTFSPGDQLNTYFDYTDPITGLSSGKLGNLPDYSREYNVIAAADPSQMYPDYTCNYMLFSSGSNYQLINTKGGYVNYEYVRIREDQNGTTGEKVLKFTHTNDINAQTAFPFPPNASQDWKRGLLLEESIYKKTTSGFDLVKSKKMEYGVLPLSVITAQGLKVGLLTAHNYAVANTVAVNGLAITPYPIQTDAYVLKTDTLVTKENGVQLQEINAYDYTSSNYKIAGISSSQSDGNILKREIYYPTDYLSNQGSSSLLSKMIARNIVDVPIEEITTLRAGSVSKLVSGTAYEYGVNALSGFDQFYLKKIYQAQTQNVFSGNKYNFLTIPSHYIEKVHTVSVNASGNPTYRIFNGSQKVVNLWSYNHQYPVAEINNASYEDVSNSLSANSLTVSTLASSALPDMVKVNALRTALNNAMISTYAYNPLIGITSQTDPKGMTTFYDYDSFGRLENIKDHNGNIIKNYAYNYSNTGSAPLITAYENQYRSESFTKNNCPLGQYGSSVRYEVEAGRYSSIISPQDADMKAMNDINANGQKNANLLGGCLLSQPAPVYYNTAITVSRTKSNCPTGQTGSVVSYTVPANAHSSPVSVDAANTLAQAEITAKAQKYADSLGTCYTGPAPTLYYNTPQTAYATKNNCAVSLVGTSVAYVVPDSTFSSPVSQLVANQLALDNANLGAQSNANSLGACVTAPPATFNFTISTPNPASFDVIFNYANGGSQSYIINSHTNLNIPVPGSGIGSVTIRDRDAQSSTYNFTLNGATMTGDGVTFNNISFDAPVTLTVARTSAYYFYNTPQSDKRMSLCLSGQTGSWVTYTVPAGRHSSLISLADANQKAQDDINANAQTYANNNGGCTINMSLNYVTPVSSISSIIIYNSTTGQQKSYPVSGTGILNDLSPGTVTIMAYPTQVPGVSFAYTLTGHTPFITNPYGGFGPFTLSSGMSLSITSNQVFQNAMLSVSITKSNCSLGQEGSAVTYTVPANTYSSTISQADANAKAQADVDANAQTYANTNGSCTVVFKNPVMSVSLAKNNCSSGQTSTPVTYTVPAGTYSSSISQAAANALAQADLDANAQGYANTNGTCAPSVTYYSAGKSVIFTRNNCAIGSTGSSVTYTVWPNKYTSTISQADANQRVQDEIDSSGQNFANTYGSCTAPIVYWNTYRSAQLKRNNCAIGMTGGPIVTYHVYANTHSSTISQADADAKAQADITANAQNYANANGTCVSSTFSISYNIPAGTQFQVVVNNSTTGIAYTYTTSGTSGTLSGIPIGNGYVNIYELNTTIGYYYTFAGAKTGFGGASTQIQASEAHFDYRSLQGTMALDISEYPQN